MASRQTNTQEDNYFRVMRLLGENPDLTQRELAGKLGISVGGLNYGLRALIDRGWVKMRNFRHSKNKFKYVYLLTPLGVARKTELTGKFLRRKLKEYELLKAEIAAIKAESKNAGARETPTLPLKDSRD